MASYHKEQNAKWIGKFRRHPRIITYRRSYNRYGSLVALVDEEDVEEADERRVCENLDYKIRENLDATVDLSI